MLSMRLPVKLYTLYVSRFVSGPEIDRRATSAWGKTLPENFQALNENINFTSRAVAPAIFIRERH